MFAFFMWSCKSPESTATADTIGREKNCNWSFKKRISGLLPSCFVDKSHLNTTFSALTCNTISSYKYSAPLEKLNCMFQENAPNTAGYKWSHCCCYNICCTSTTWTAMQVKDQHETMTDNPSVQIIISPIELIGQFVHTLLQRTQVFYCPQNNSVCSFSSDCLKSFSVVSMFKIR